MKPDFLIDVDEVLADFVNAAIPVISQVLQRPWSLDEASVDNWDMFAVLTPETKRDVFQILNARGFCSSLQPTPGAQDFIRELRQYRNVYALTSPQHSPFWVYERNQWLGDHFGFDPKHTINTEAKYMCVGQEFLDDNPVHIERWKARHKGAGMLWSTVHNRRMKGHDELRVNSWDEVLKRVTDQGSTV